MKRLQYTIITILSFTILSSCNTGYKSVPQGGALYLEVEEIGSKISSQTFTTLSSELKKSMSKGGLPNAIKYCNLNALSITDSLSQIHQAKIKRTSLKFRNPKNKPSVHEETILNTFNNQRANNEDMTPLVFKHNNELIYHAPIVMQELCTKCHGNKSDIKNYQNILEAYPNDLAVGYQAGDLRGMWSITIKR